MSRWLIVGIALVLPFLVTTCLDAQEYRFNDALNNKDRFSSEWDADFGFDVVRNAVVHTTQAKEFALPRNSPVGRNVTAEASITIRRAIGKEWKVAGVVIYRDERNYWGLALCEAPARSGELRSVDFQEMREGTWCAQWEDKLPAFAVANLPPFQWEYNTQYRIRLEMDANSVTGTVEDYSGRPLWRRGFRLRSPAVMEGRPGISSSQFASEFRDFRARVAERVAERTDVRQAPAFDASGYGRIKVKATGTYRTEQRDGLWWLFDPTGNASLYAGVDHVSYRAGWCETLGYSPYTRNAAAKHGNEENWAKSTVARLKSWGFNGMGAGGNESVVHKGLAHTRFVGLGEGFCGIGPDYRITWPDNNAPTPCSLFPNVFHPRFAEYCQTRARKLCAATREDPWLLGSFIDNELAWWGKSWGEKYGLFDECVRKPADHSAKRAWVDWMKSRYSSAAEMAKVWDTSARSMDELMAVTAVRPVDAAAAMRDKRDFVVLIAERYFATTAAAIRSADPNHMILGCRFAGLTNEAYEDVLPVAGKYCDVVSVNIYEKVDLNSGEVYAMSNDRRVGLSEVLDQFNSRAGGKPIMVTEWSYPAYDSGLPCKHGAGQRVETQAQRAFCFEQFQKFLFSRPYVVGSSYFMWADEPALGISATFPEDSNYGLVNEKDEPYQLLTEVATRVNAMRHELHLGETAEIAVSATGGGAFTLANSGKADAAVKLTAWVDGKASESRIDIPAGSQQVRSVDVRTLSAGAHLLVVSAQADGAENRTSDNAASQVIVVPGADLSAVPPAEKRFALVVANPAGEASPVGPVIVDGGMLPAGYDWIGAKGRLRAYDASASAGRLPLQIDAIGNRRELAIQVGEIAPRSCRMIVVQVMGEPVEEVAARFKRSGSAFLVEGKRLKLSHSTGASEIFDRVSLGGTEIGSFTAMMHQRVPKKVWMPLEAIGPVEVSDGPVRTVLLVTGTASGPVGYRTVYRVVVPAEGDWFTSEAISVENGSSDPWQLAACFHYARSRIGGNDRNDEPVGSTWVDAAAGLTYGIYDPTYRTSATFWKDSAQHPDFMVPTDLKLEPRKRMTLNGPEVYVGVADGAGREGWSSLCQRIDAIRRLTVHIQPLP